jgi:hypothetical protein
MTNTVELENAAGGAWNPRCRRGPSTMDAALVGGLNRLHDDLDVAAT